MPDIESMIKAQRVLCIKKFIENNPAGWKVFLGFYLKNVGGKFLFQCNFDFTKLPIALPDFYKECFNLVFFKRGQPFLAFRYSKSGLMEQQVYMH